MGAFDDTNTAAAVADATNNIANAYVAVKGSRAAREWQEKMWQAQNEYNLPINQRRRLEEAGINPNLAFGSSASASGGSVPGSPSVPSVHMTLGQFYLAKKQADAQIAMQRAQTDRYREETEEKRMQNEMFAQLFEDKYLTDKQDYYVRRLVQGWQEDHIRHSLDVGLQSQEAQKDLFVLRQDLVKAQTDHTRQSFDNLVQTYNHLASKYNYEDMYYGMNMNPYDNSTILGYMRYFYGAIKSLAHEFGVEL